MKERSPDGVPTHAAAVGWRTAAAAAVVERLGDRCGRRPAGRTAHPPQLPRWCVVARAGRRPGRGRGGARRHPARGQLAARRAACRHRAGRARPATGHPGGARRDAGGLAAGERAALRRGPAARTERGPSIGPRYRSHRIGQDPAAARTDGRDMARAGPRGEQQARPGGRHHRAPPRLVAVGRGRRHRGAVGPDRFGPLPHRRRGLDSGGGVGGGDGPGTSFWAAQASEVLAPVLAWAWLEQGRAGAAYDALAPDAEALGGAVELLTSAGLETLARPLAAALDALAGEGSRRADSAFATARAALAPWRAPSLRRRDLPDLDLAAW